MIDQDEALALAKSFLDGRPGADGPFSVRAEQDGWIIRVPDQDGQAILVYIDIEDDVPAYLSEAVINVDLQPPE